MSSLGSKQTGVPGLSARAAVGHLGRAQQPPAPLLSGRATLGHLGVGRRYTDTTGLLHTHRLALPAPPLPDFARLRADAQRLQQQLAAHDGLSTTSPAPFHAPMMTPAMQARLKQEQQEQVHRHRAAYARQLLAEYNRLKQTPYIVPALRDILLKSQVSLLNELGAKPAVPTGPDSFMPNSFWKSQNPYNDPKVGWALCCATVKSMMEAHYGAGKIPNNRFDLVAEHRTNVWAHGYRVRDVYIAAPDKAKAAKGLALLDQYMTLHKPVMVGVSHTVNLLFSSKNRKTGNTTYREINDGTIDHFVAIVGTGIDAKGKYYRFFDVGTTEANRKNGVSPLNRLYYNPTTGFYEGKTQVGHKVKYVLTQLRLFASQ